MDYIERGFYHALRDIELGNESDQDLQEELQGNGYVFPACFMYTQVDWKLIGRKCWKQQLCQLNHFDLIDLSA